MIKIFGDQKGCKLDLKLALNESDDSAGKGTYGMDKSGSVKDRLYMKLGSESLGSLRVMTQLGVLQRPQCVVVVDGATHSQKVGVEGNGGRMLLEGWCRGLCAVPAWRFCKKKTKKKKKKNADSRQCKYKRHGIGYCFVPRPA
jgi:hypothetical protein